MTFGYKSILLRKHKSILSGQYKFDELEAAVDMAIAACCDGDLRDTIIRAPLIANSFLMEEMERYRSLISPGFVRGKLSLFDLP